MFGISYLIVFLSLHKNCTKGAGLFVCCFVGPHTPNQSLEKTHFSLKSSKRSSVLKVENKNFSSSWDYESINNSNLPQMDGYNVASNTNRTKWNKTVRIKYITCWCWVLTYLSLGIFFVDLVSVVLCGVLSAVMSFDSLFDSFSNIFSILFFFSFRLSIKHS